MYFIYFLSNFYQFHIKINFKKTRAEKQLGRIRNYITSFPTPVYQEQAWFEIHIK